MKKNRWIFFGIFGLFHLGAFIFTIFLGKILFDIVGWVPYFKWITLFRLLLLIVDIVWTMSAQRESAREKAALTQELDTLKARLFDLQEAAKTQPARPTGNPKA